MPGELGLWSTLSMDSWPGHNSKCAPSHDDGLWNIFDITTTLNVSDIRGTKSVTCVHRTQNKISLQSLYSLQAS